MLLELLVFCINQLLQLVTLRDAVLNELGSRLVELVDRYVFDEHLKVFPLGFYRFYAQSQVFASAVSAAHHVAVSAMLWLLACDESSLGKTAIGSAASA